MAPKEDDFVFTIDDDDFVSDDGGAEDIQEVAKLAGQGQKRKHTEDPDLHVLPKGAQWCDDAELRAQKVWDGVLFRLGWWNSDGQSEQEGQGGYFKLDSI